MELKLEAVMLGQPIYMLLPEVVGFELTGSLRPGVTATDMTLRIVEMLREHGVVGKFVEFHGPGMSALTLPRAQQSPIWLPNMERLAAFSLSMRRHSNTCDYQVEIWSMLRMSSAI